ncbi:hypothetical protein PINS_up002901 [Pythium insidiosum]|nr:hypothetical protein PINS_up002901 [Pythium insidiosum]
MSGGCAVSSRGNAPLDCATVDAVHCYSATTAAAALAAGPAPPSHLSSPPTLPTPRKRPFTTVTPPAPSLTDVTASNAATGTSASSSSSSSSSSSATATPSAAAPTSCARSVVTAIERSVLRTLAFVLYHLDRDQARQCVTSLLQWYSQLHTQLPLFAADSLDQVATSLVALSDAEFTKFWLSLAASSSSADDTSVSDASAPSSTDAAQDGDVVVSVANDVLDGDQQSRESDATLVRRLYEHIFYRIQRLFGLPSARRSRHDGPWHTQTPLTSPDDKFDDSHFRRRKSRSYGATHSPNHIALPIIADDSSINASADDVQANQDDSESTLESRGCSFVGGEPGWAVEYMEQESRMPLEMTRRMHKMMHTAIPLNLFRVAVVYRHDGGDSDDDDDAERIGFVGVISPESFPPTPITRDLQTRRMQHYTITVLDHATLALRLLEANYAA